jgi:hypothetical protein
MSAAAAPSTRNRRNSRTSRGEEQQIDVGFAHNDGGLIHEDSSRRVVFDSHGGTLGRDTGSRRKGASLLHIIPLGR